MADRYEPRTQSEIYKSLIETKRALVAAGLTDWVTEEAGDYGINILNSVAFELAKHESYVDFRTKQSHVQNGHSREPIMDGARNIGHRCQGPTPAIIPIIATSKEATKISQGDRFYKTLEDNSDIGFEAISDVIFTGAETKKFYAVQGEVITQVVTGTGLEYQKVYIPTPNVANAYFSVTEEGDPTLWQHVLDFSQSTPSSRHFMVEFDYSFRPIIIFSDGVFGKRPLDTLEYTIMYRKCSGATGNVSPGVMRLGTANSSLTLIENSAPEQSILDVAVEITDTEITVEDDGSISAFSTAGVAYIGGDGDSFSYDGIIGNSFQNVTGLDRYHAKGEVIRYVVGQIQGSDRETLEEIKLSALREIRMRETGGSVKEIAYLASRVPGVARAGAFSIAHTQFVHIVPYHAGVPDNVLLRSVATALASKKIARHSIRVVPPMYAYVDVELEITPIPGRDWGSEVYPKVLSVLQYFLSPLSRTSEGASHVSSWGRKLKKSELTYYLMYTLGGTYIMNIEYNHFKRSTELTGLADVTLGNNELANIGTLRILNSENLVDPSTITSEIGF